MNDPFSEAIRHRIAQRSQWMEANTQALVEAGCDFEVTQNGECLCLREVEGLSVDYYVCDKRWTHSESGKFMRGGHDVFLRWYLRMKEKMA